MGLGTPAALATGAGCLLTFDEVVVDGLSAGLPLAAALAVPVC